jgi:eukaryotic translation initiation factor 2C
VYYAHLASNRARSHESAASSDGPRGGQKFEEAQQDAANRRVQQGTAAGSSQTGTTEQECLPLLEMGNLSPNITAEMIDAIRSGMWYI